MTQTIIKWKTGIFKANTSKCYEEIQQIGDEVQPEQVLDKARDKLSEPLFLTAFHQHLVNPLFHPYRKRCYANVVFLCQFIPRQIVYLTLLGEIINVV